MSHNHDHGDHEHGHDHEHAHTDTGGLSDNVYMHIDRDNVIALNSNGEGKGVIKPWDERLDERVVSICSCLRRYWLYLYLHTVYRVGCRRSAVGRRIIWLPRLPIALTTEGSIIRIPFTGSVKLRALLLKSGPGEQTPAKVALVRDISSLTKTKDNLQTFPSFANLQSSLRTSATLISRTPKTRNLCKSLTSP